MTAKNSDKTRARALMALVGDETGSVPPYTRCLAMVEKHAKMRGQCATDEEFLCRIFEAEWPAKTEGRS